MLSLAPASIRDGREIRDVRLPSLVRYICVHHLLADSDCTCFTPAPLRLSHQSHMTTSLLLFSTLEALELEAILAMNDMLSSS